MTMIALFGSRGFVGSEISNSLKKSGYEFLEITRENFEQSLGKEFDYVINAAMPSARFKAKNNQLWDFRETVEKTAKIFYGTKFSKFIQISSIAARCQTDTVYGRNKLAAESIVNDRDSLIVRLGPMFGKNLKKGILVDILNQSTCYMDRNSKQSFAPVGFNAEWIVRNMDRRGIWEVGTKNSIRVGDLVDKLGLNVDFKGDIDHQEIQTVEEDYPDVNLVIDFLKDHPLYNNYQDIGN